LSKILSVKQATQIISREYPDIRKGGFKILKRFGSNEGRKYNTFLIEHAQSKIVAKGNVFDVADLELERFFLKALDKTNCSP